MKLHFSIRDLLWLTLAAALGVALVCEHLRHRHTADALRIQRDQIDFVKLDLRFRQNEILTSESIDWMFEKLDQLPRADTNKKAMVKGGSP
jgi:hypothetical protein